MRRWSGRLLTAARSRWLLAAASPLLLVTASAVLFGPAVRAVAFAEAAQHRLDLRIGSVRPGWGGIRLFDLTARLQGVDGIEAKIDQACVSLGWNLRLGKVELNGVSIRAHGTRAILLSELRDWRGGQEATPTKSRDAPRGPRVSVTGLRFAWFEGASTAPQAEAHDVDISVDRDHALISIPSATARSGRWVGTLGGASLDTTRDGVVRKGRSATLVARYTVGGDEGDSVLAPQLPPLPNRVLPGFPDLAALGASIRLLTTGVSERITPDADVGVDALTWQIESKNEPESLTIGPGPMSLVRVASSLQIRFSTDASSARTPLAIEATLPLDGADAVFALDGGPVSLALLGVHEGAAGLVDVARASAIGRARIVLAGDGTSLTFDGDGGLHSLALRNVRLARDVLRDIDLDLRARGVATAQGGVRVDDFGATLGSIQVSAAASLEQDTTHLAGTIRAEVPSSDCQSLLDSVPTALLPSLHGMRMAGTFEGHGRIEFDTRALDDLKLDYEISDHCRIAVPVAALAPERFQGPFVYRIRLPDGSTSEETTGPGSDNWTSLKLISPFMQVAVLTTEDGGFLHHHGFNRAAIRSSIIANLEGGRFLRGASTITMQLAKNLFLSRDKTVSRKLEEVVLTEYLEQTFPKQQLMELYLNVIEFGPSVYGITAAAEHYFGRKPAELNLAECLFLASILPSPLRLGSMREAGTAPQHWMRLLRKLMETAHRLGRITDEELTEAEAEPVAFWNGTDRPPPRPPVHAERPIDTETRDIQTDAVPDPPEDGP
jgi:Transglycosylase